VVGIVGVVVLLILMALPRSRETARLATCEQNLMRIGQVLAYYDGATGHLPAIPAPGEAGRGPLSEILGQFGLGGLRDLDALDAKALASRAKAARVESREHFVAEFVCPSDPHARSGQFAAPVSYRANAGPGTDGSGGPFAFGHPARMAQAEAEAGTEFTAAFAERRIGSGRGGQDPANDYHRLPGPIDPAGCPTGPAETWRGDAGSSWVAADWTSTLYNHAMAPNAQPSCIAEDGRTARMGASSTHAGRVNVLMLGGSVRGFSPTVAPEVWRKFGGLTAKDRAPTPAPG